MTASEFLAAFAAEVGGPTPTVDEFDALLELAAIAAHAIRAARRTAGLLDRRRQRSPGVRAARGRAARAARRRRCLGAPVAVSIDEARAAVLEHVRVLDSEEVVLDDALGRALADDASAPNDVPPFAASAMDGFAIRAADTARRLARGSSSSARRRPARAPGVGGAPRHRRADLDRRAGARRRRRDRAAGADDRRRTRRSSIDGQIARGLRTCARAGEDIRAGELVVPPARCSARPSSACWRR